MRRTAAALLVFTLVVSCGDDEPSGPPAPTTGSITATTATTGDDIPASYTVVLDGGASQLIDANGSVTFTDLSPSSHTVELTGVPANCTVTSTNPVTVTVTAGADSPVAIRVSCIFTWSGQVFQGDAIEIRGINGGISASLASGAEVEVSATKDGQNSDPSTVTIEVVEHAGGVTICAVYPDVQGEPANECAPGGGQMTVRDNDVTVEFEVQVPAGVRLIEWTVNGDVRAANVQSEVAATTVNGVASVSTSEVAVASTVNGDVEVTIGDESPDQNLALATVNGNVTLRVPVDIDADVVATTVSGTMNSDFLLSNPAPGQWTGTLGAGGSDLILSTVNGNLELRSVP